MDFHGYKLTYIRNLADFSKLWTFHGRLFRVEARSNTSSVALRVLGGTKREPSAWGLNWAKLLLGPSLSGWGSLETETIKCGHESRRTET
jgi:hypothetical protein